MTTAELKKYSLSSFADAHNHLWINTGTSIKGLSGITDFNLIKKRLIDFKKAGGSLIVECTPYGAGRDVNILNRLSELSGITIIPVTGFHKKQYYLKSPFLWEMEMEQAYHFFLDEIYNGCTEKRSMNSRPGAVKIAFTGSLEGQYLTLSRAAVRAVKKTGLPLLVHTERGFNTGLLIDFLEENGMDISRVLLFHMDKNNDSTLHKKLAKRGVCLEYDTFLRPKYDPDNNAMPLLVEMIKEGFGDKIMIGSDIDSDSMWKDLGRMGGLGGFFRSIEEKLSNLQLKRNIIMNPLSLNCHDFFNLK